MDIIDRINNISLWCFRLIPTGLLCLLFFHYHVLGTEATILEFLILLEYYLLVMVKLPKYEIAEGPLALLLFQLAIVVYAITELNIVSIESPIERRLVFALFLLLYTFLTFWIAKGFVLRKRQEDIDDLNVPECDVSSLSENSKCLLACFDEINDMQQGFQEQRRAVDELTIPIPGDNTQENSTPFVDYLRKMSDLPNQYPALASLEQFFEIMVTNQHWDNMFVGFRGGFDTMLTGSGNYLSGLKTVLDKTKDSIHDFVHHPDNETASQLFHNVANLLNDDFHSSMFRFRFSHADGLQGEALYVARKFAIDSLKGGAQTFLDTDSIHDLNEELLSSIRDGFDEILSSSPQEIEIDVFSPDFDGSAHFPFISTTIEAFRLAEKWTDGDVDMVSAAEKSAVKIAGTAGGAYMGSAIGTLICPGVGTAIGAMVGSWLCRKAANSINRQELEQLQSEYEAEYRRLVDMAENAKQHIANTQNETAVVISSLAIEESDKFDRVKNTSPFEKISNNELLYAVDVILKDYFVTLIENRGIKDGFVSEFRSYIPTQSQIRQHPRECLEQMLSAENLIMEHYQGTDYIDFELVMQICIEMMVKKLALYEILQCVWFTEIYDAYKASVSNVLTGSDKYIKDYVETVKRENDKIDNQRRIVKDAENRVAAEARTL